MKTTLPQAPRIATPTLPSPPRTAAARPPATAAPPDSDLERAHRFGHRFEPSDGIASAPVGRGETAAPMPIQRGKEKGKKQQESTAQTPLLGNATPVKIPTHHGPQMNIQVENDMDPKVSKALEAPKTTLLQKVLSAASGVGSTAQSATRAAEFVDAAVPGKLTPALGASASPFAVAASAVEGGAKLKQMASGNEQAADKAVLGLEATSSFANATLSGTSAARYASALGAGSTATALSVAGPAAIAVGGADLLGGFVSNRLAARRQGEIDEALNQRSIAAEHTGMARFARDSLQTKKTRGLGTMLKGGLAIGGGAALLAGASPIGWGLLGGAALVGGGLTAYKQYRKHKLGKEILNNPRYQEELKKAGIAMPTEHDLESESRKRRWAPWNTKSSRRHDLIRAQIALKLHDEMAGTTLSAAPHEADYLKSLNKQQNRNRDDLSKSTLTAIVGRLGLRNKGGATPPKIEEIASALEG